VRGQFDLFPGRSGAGDLQLRFLDHGPRHQVGGRAGPFFVQVAASIIAPITSITSIAAIAAPITLIAAIAATRPVVVRPHLGGLGSVAPDPRGVRHLTADRRPVVPRDGEHPAGERLDRSGGGCLSAGDRLVSQSLVPHSVMVAAVVLPLVLARVMASLVPAGNDGRGDDRERRRADQHGKQGPSHA
jgi:hypothetical protein